MSDIHCKNIRHLYWHFDVRKENFPLLMQVKLLLEDGLFVLEHLQLEPVGDVVQQRHLDLVDVKEVLG